ncbi:hypothetical protein QNM99_05935 [Pseudomonas sp. PCH446]
MHLMGFEEIQQFATAGTDQLGMITSLCPENSCEMPLIDMSKKKPAFRATVAGVGQCRWWCGSARSRS